MHCRPCLALPRHILVIARRTFTSNTNSIPVLEHVSIEDFRNGHFKPGNPVQLTQHFFKTLPAINKWFMPHSDETSELNQYLREHGNITVPIEFTQLVVDSEAKSEQTEFRRLEAPLATFLDAAEATRGPSWDPARGPWLYLAQCPILSLPQALQDDIPVPDLVRHAGKGDIYDSSIWLGRAPTYTSLHKDPNPNLFVQLAGRKRVRLIDPDRGTGIYLAVQRVLGQTHGQASMRGEEMMAGAEKDLLKKWVWEDAEGPQPGNFLEATLVPGDGLFIPKGWWHSIMSVGKGMTGSVSLTLISSDAEQKH